MLTACVGELIKEMLRGFAPRKVGRVNVILLDLRVKSAAVLSPDFMIQVMALLAELLCFAGGAVLCVRQWEVKGLNWCANVVVELLGVNGSVYVSVVVSVAGVVIEVVAHNSSSPWGVGYDGIDA